MMMNNDGADWRQQEEQEEQQFHEYLEEQKKWFKKTLAEFEKNFGGNTNDNVSNTK
jgi:hypothetical protein